MASGTRFPNVTVIYRRIYQYRFRSSRFEFSLATLSALPRNYYSLFAPVLLTTMRRIGSAGNEGWICLAERRRTYKGEDAVKRWRRPKEVPRNKEQKWANSRSAEIKRLGRGEEARLKGEGAEGEAEEKKKRIRALVPLQIFAD